VAERSDAPLAAIVLCAVGFGLLAPVLGRLGLPRAADAAMALAAVCGVGAFAMAALATVRAARRPPPPRDGASSPQERS
jgi:hypothetical protein